MSREDGGEAPAAGPHHDPKDAGWTWVKRKSNRRHVSSRNPPDQTTAKTLRPKTDHLRPVADIDAEYRKIRAQWESTACCNALRSLMSTSLSSVRVVREAICLGIGSFDPADGGWSAKRTTYVQLIAFLIMVEELETTTKRKIPCVFQEPLFATSDKAFLIGLGHRVVDNPDACTMVSSDSLLFGVHLYAPLYVEALRSSMPVIFVGTGHDVWDQLPVQYDLGNLEAMGRTHAMCPFPQDDGTDAFSNTSLYWRDPSPRGPSNDSTTASSGQLAQQKVAASDHEQELAETMQATTIS